MKSRSYVEQDLCNKLFILYATTYSVKRIILSILFAITWSFYVYSGILRQKWHLESKWLHITWDIP